MSILKYSQLMTGPITLPFTQCIARFSQKTNNLQDHPLGKGGPQQSQKLLLQLLTGVFL